MRCPNHFLFSHPFAYKSLCAGTINNQLAGVKGGYAFFGGDLTMREGGGRLC